MLLRLRALILGWLPGAKPPGSRDITLVTERAAHLKLAVDVGSDPITGTVTVEEGAPSSFCGWIELVAAIEAVRHDRGGVTEEPPPTTGAQPIVPSTAPAAEDSPVAAPAQPTLG